MPDLVCSRSRTAPVPIQRITSGSALMAAIGSMSLSRQRRSTRRGVFSTGPVRSVILRTEVAAADSAGGAAQVGGRDAGGLPRPGVAAPGDLRDRRQEVLVVYQH